MYIYAFIYPQFPVESTGISLWINRGVFSLCGQSIFHPQPSVDDISRAAADDFGVIPRLPSLYYDCENLSFYLRGFLCPSPADTLCM